MDSSNLHPANRKMDFHSFLPSTNYPSPPISRSWIPPPVPDTNDRLGKGLLPLSPNTNVAGPGEFWQTLCMGCDLGRKTWKPLGKVRFEPQFPLTSHSERCFYCQISYKIIFCPVVFIGETRLWWGLPSTQPPRPGFTRVCPRAEHLSDLKDRWEGSFTLSSQLCTWNHKP